MKKILITGFAGFIGKHLTNALLEHGGYTIYGVDNLSGSEFESVNTKIDRFFINDFNSKPVLEMVRKQEIDAILHLAAKPRVSYSVEYPSETNQNNVQNTVELLELCRGNIERFIFSSSSSVYGGADVLPTPETYPKNPKSPYALQKSVVEDYLKMFAELYGMDAVSLRYFNVFGPKCPGNSPYATAVSSWIHKIKNNLPLRSDGDGTQSRDMCYVENVVSANMLALQAKQKFTGNCYNIACNESTTNNEILAYLKKKFRNIEVINAPTRPGDVYKTRADISLAEKELGYKVLYSFWNGLEKTLAYEFPLVM